MEPPYRPSPLAEGIAWATRITTVSLEMVIPAVGGYFLDEKLGTGPLLLLIGVVLGLTTSVYHLVKLTASTPSSPKSGARRTDETEREKL